MAETQSKTLQYRARRALQWLELLADNIDRHDTLRYSAAISYTTALSIAPFILVVLSIVAFLNLGIQSDILLNLYGFIGEDTAKALDIVVTNTKATQLTSISGFLSLFLLAFSASALFAQLRTSLDLIALHQIPPQPFNFLKFIEQRVLSIVWVFAFILIIIFSIFLTIVMRTYYMPTNLVAASVTAFLMNFILFVIAFMLLYRFVPTNKVTWNRCLISGAISSVCFLIGKYLIGIYLSHTIVSNSVGAVGSIIVFLIWVYYVSLVVLISYECTNVFFERKWTNPDGVSDIQSAR